MAIRCHWSTVKDAVAPCRELTHETRRTEEAALAFTRCWPTVLNTDWVTQADASTNAATINRSDLRWTRFTGLLQSIKVAVVCDAAANIQVFLTTHAQGDLGEVHDLKIQYNTIQYSNLQIIQIQYSLYNSPFPPKIHKNLPRIGAQAPGCFLPGRQLGAAHSNSAIFCTQN